MTYFLQWSLTQHFGSFTAYFLKWYQRTETVNLTDTLIIVNYQHNVDEGFSVVQVTLIHMLWNETSPVLLYIGTYQTACCTRRSQYICDRPISAHRYISQALSATFYWQQVSGVNSSFTTANLGAPNKIPFCWGGSRYLKTRVDKSYLHGRTPLQASEKMCVFSCLWFGWKTPWDYCPPNELHVPFSV